MDQIKLAEFAKNSENKEGADFTQAVQEAGIAQGSLIVSRLYNTMLGEVTRVLKSWNEELTNVLSAAGINPSSLTNEQILSALMTLIKKNSGGTQLGDLVPNIGTTSPIGRVLCNGKRLVACKTIFPDFYAYVINSTPYKTVAEFNEQVNTFGQCGFCAVDGDDVLVPLITRPISGVSSISQCGQAVLDTMRQMKGLFTSLDRGDRGKYSAPFSVQSRWSTDIKGGGGDQWGTYVQMDTATLGVAYNGAETRGKQVQYPYYIQVYTAPSSQSLVNVAELINLLEYQNQLGIITLPSGGNIALKSGGIYRGTLSRDTAFVLPTVNDNTLLNQILIQLKIEGTPSINWGTTNYFNSELSSSAGNSNVIYEYDALIGGWVVGQIEKVVV